MYLNSLKFLGCKLTFMPFKLYTIIMIIKNKIYLLEKKYSNQLVYNYQIVEYVQPNSIQILHSHLLYLFLKIYQRPPTQFHLHHIHSSHIAKANK